MSKTSTAPTSQPLTRQNTIRFVTNIESELDSVEEPRGNIVETSTTRPSERLVENGNPNLLKSTQSKTRSPMVNEHTEQVASSNAKGISCGCCVSWSRIQWWKWPVAEKRKGQRQSIRSGSSCITGIGYLSLLNCFKEGVLRAAAITAEKGSSRFSVLGTEWQLGF